MRVSEADQDHRGGCRVRVRIFHVRCPRCPVRGSAAWPGRGPRRPAGGRCARCRIRGAPRCARCWPGAHSYVAIGESVGLEGDGDAGVIIARVRPARSRRSLCSRCGVRRPGGAGARRPGSPRSQTRRRSLPSGWTTTCLPQRHRSPPGSGATTLKPSVPNDGSRCQLPAALTVASLAAATPAALAAASSGTLTHERDRCGQRELTAVGGAHDRPPCQRPSRPAITSASSSALNGRPRTWL